MFNVISIVSVALVATSSVSALYIPLVSRATAPSTYDAAILEDYSTYNARYTALDCENQHNTAFFDSCCHPLKAGESLDSRPSQCNPANLAASPSSSGAAAEPTDDSDLPFCSDEPDDGSSSATPTPTPTPAPAAVAPEADPTTTPTSTKTSTHHSSSTHKPAATPAAAPSDSGSGQTFTGGVATFFYQGGVAGACGTVHSDSDLIAAIDQDRYGNSGAVSPLCGQKVHITNKNNGKSVTVTIADDCPTCINSNSIDLSVGAFTQIATEEEGEVPIEWQFA